MNFDFSDEQTMLRDQARRFLSDNATPKQEAGGEGLVATKVDRERKLAVILHADIVGSTVLVHCDETIAHARITTTPSAASAKRSSPTQARFGRFAAKKAEVPESPQAE